MTSLYNSKQLYANYLKSDHWKELRKNFYLRDKNHRKCFICGNPDNLNLHHKTYKRLGNEKYKNLVALCKKHHYQCHEYVLISRLFGFRSDINNIVRKIKITQRKKTDLVNSWYKHCEREFKKGSFNVIGVG